MKINRPVIKDYWNEDNNFKWGIYTEKLEQYCDYIEKCLKEKEEFINKLTSESNEDEDIARCKYYQTVMCSYSTCDKCKFNLCAENQEPYIKAISDCQGV